MGRINGWKRLKWYSNLDGDEVQREVETDGRCVIAAWRHDDLGTKLEHIYEPDADKPFKVRLLDDQVELEQEGRYEYRGEGGSANKDLMRNYP
jgi:hypothetical protein